MSLVCKMEIATLRDNEWIDSGSSRCVYGISQNTVAKIASGLAGCAQNRAEVELSGKHFLFNPVIKHDINYKYIISRRVQPLDVPSNTFREICEWYLHKYSRDIYQVLTRLVKEHDLCYADLTKVNSWGKIGDDYTILDYGLTQEVYNEYY